MHILTTFLQYIISTLKGPSREWHSCHTNNLQSKIDALKFLLSVLNYRGEDVLSDIDIEEMHSITSDIRSPSRIHIGICW